MSEHSPEDAADLISELEAIENRVLWLASLIVHAANERKDPAGVKVGGHQASSASCVSILTALYFNHLTAHDRIAVKPHASPVLYAIQYLMGRLPREQLSTLRAFDGLQAYPSQTKNPAFVDYSTGSVGLGAAAVNFSALTAHYLRTKQLLASSGDFWALVGDAELDEGNVWEALAEPLFDDIPGIRWIIDLNRQSLDRVVPGMRVKRLERLFEANGWRIIEAKYGHELEAIFGRPSGEHLRTRIDEMSNDEYQSIISGPVQEIRGRLAANAGSPATLHGLLDDLSDAELLETITALGGHDQRVLKSALDEASSQPGPAVIFAYTIKGWRLPFAGDPFNHSAVMSHDQMSSLAARLGISDDWYATIDSGDVGAALIEQATSRLQRPPSAPEPELMVPVSVNATVSKRSSTQDAFGRVIAHLHNAAPDVAERIVTVTPDVSISTSLAAWINRAGAWKPTARESYSDDALLKWGESPSGQHLELGISEMNLFSLLGQLGLTGSTFGVNIAPVGTVYDTFISRGLDALVYGLYCGSSFVLVGTPSGVTLAPEGGAHQSTFTPGLGISLPGLVSYEPAFAKETEWILLDAIKKALRGDGSSYLRLSTLPVDQSLFLEESDGLRRQILEGAYRLIDRRSEPGYSPNHAVLLFASGSTIPNACEASALLADEGVFASVINVTSADSLFRKWSMSAQVTIETARHQPNPFPTLLSDDELGLPAIVVTDGHPQSLAFIGTALNVPSVSLGVATFGESGTVADLHRKHHLDPDSLVNAAVSLVDRPQNQAYAVQ